MGADARGGDDSFFWEYLGCEPPDLAAAAQQKPAEQAQRQRQPQQHVDERPPEPWDVFAAQDGAKELTPAPTAASNAATTTGTIEAKLTLQQAIEMQDLLIEEYKREDFQEKLHEAWAAARGDQCRELRARQAVCLPIQAPIIARFGFEPTRKGVNQSVLAFRPYNGHPEVEDRNLTMQYLVNPPQQNTKWIHGFEEPPKWWRRAQRRAEPADETAAALPREEQASDPLIVELAPPVAEAPKAVPARAPAEPSAPKSFSPGNCGQEVPRAASPRSSLGEPLSDGLPEHRRAAASIDDAIDQLSRLQIVLAVPTVMQIRASRPLRRFDDEIYVAQFVLQSTSRNFSKFLGSEEGKVRFHPFLKPSDAADADDDSGGSFGWLDDKTRVLYQTNGIARTEEPIVNRPIKCERTGAPGHYIETKMLVARRRARGAVGQYGSGLKAARSFRTRQDIEDNLFYSFTSCWQIYACTACVGELGEDDSGERILIRRSIRDFTQHHFHDFPVAKHLAELLDGENQALIQAFSYDPTTSIASSLFQYQCFTLRSWQTYEFEEKPPEDDVGVRLVSAARIGHVAELRRLVLESGCDCDTIISEFGMFGAGRTGSYTRSELGFAEERNALIAAVEAGWLSVVQAIIAFAEEGKASLDVVCHEWNPTGIGGAGLRGNYTALDMARIYHRDEIREALAKAGARVATACPRPSRDNPFTVRARQDRGEYEDKGWEHKEREDRYADFSFVEWGEEVQMDAEMQFIVRGVGEELRQLHGLGQAEHNKAFKKLCLRWHPDKHPDQKKSLATRVFQWLQRAKADTWESKAWTA